MVDLLVYTNHRMGDMYYNIRCQMQMQTKLVKLKLKVRGWTENFEPKTIEPKIGAFFRALLVIRYDIMMKTT